jgi:16S rRNA (cytosine1407-C5)-methyltransferase
MSKKRAPGKRSQEAAPDLLERYRGLLNEQAFAEMLAALQQPPPQALRANLLKVQPDQAIEDWQARYGWQTQTVPFCPTGWQILSAKVPPSQTIEFRLGEYYIQDAASMLPAELFDFSDLEAPLILDLAAAPGGKTTHLVSRSFDRGLVIGNDSSPGRIGMLRGVLRDWGAINTAVTAFPGERFGGWFPETFARVLLDAPCSMENLRPSGAHPRRSTSASERESLAGRQLRLLASAFQALKPGGQVVYSTCTLAPEEDEAVLDGLLHQYPGAVEIVDVSRRFERTASGLSGDEQHEFSPVVQNAVRLWPHLFGTSGFFAALIRKTALVQGERQEPPARPLERVGWQCLSAKETTGVCEFFLEEYGFDLKTLIARQRLELWRRGAGIQAVPELYRSVFGDFPAEGLGLLVGEETAKGLEISHEWAARFGREFTSGKYEISDDRVAAWIRGEDLQGAPGERVRTGQTVIVVDADGRVLGRGRVQAQRIKNLLPRRLV